MRYNYHTTGEGSTVMFTARLAPGSPYPEVELSKFQFRQLEKLAETYTTTDGYVRWGVSTANWNRIIQLMGSNYARAK